MSGRDGHIELDRAVDTIQVGHRHRKDLGDLTDLCASIERLGLLQPITITPGDVLLCGARRLAAVKHLGWRTVKVWVRSGISGQLELLMAERHENTMRAPLSPTEAAELYRELKAVLAEDASRRQQATRFGTERNKTAGEDGDAESASPPETRKHAARLVTGRESHARLEQVGELQALANDPRTAKHIRSMAADALKAMDADGKVYGRYAAVKAAQAANQLEDMAADSNQPASLRNQATRELERLRSHDNDVPAADLLKLTKDALQRANVANPTSAETRPGPNRNRGVRTFVVMWSELKNWTEEYDPVEIGPGLSDEQWTVFESTIDATVAFTNAARQARLQANAGHDAA